MKKGNKRVVSAGTCIFTRCWYFISVKGVICVVMIVCILFLKELKAL